MDGKDFLKSKMTQMDNQIQLKEDKKELVPYSPSLKNALQAGDRAQIPLILRKYKTSTGAANFPELFSIPTEQRLAKMAEQDYGVAITLVGAAVTMAMENLNLRTPMNPSQIADLSDAILDSSAEDNLSLEDLVLFLQQLTRGKYNPLFESLDVAKFMEKFEIYREERHKTMLEYRENKHLEYKSLGDPSRVTKAETAFEEHLQSFTSKLQEKNDEIKLLRREAREK